MMKRFSLTLMGLLMLLGGVKAVDIDPSTGNLNENVGFEDSNKRMVFHDNNPKYSLIGSTTWAEGIPSGKKHVFTLKVTTDGIQSSDKLSKLYIVALNNIKTDNQNKLKDADNFNSNNTFKDEIIVASDNVTITTDEEYTLTIEISDNQTYEAIALYTDNSGWKKIKVNSFTRTVVDDVPAVAVPTISPDLNTYDGDFRVTITPGDGNTSVKYSISGSTSHDVTNEVITEETVISFTDNQNITVTATGYDGENASSPVTNTYTYGVPSGKTSASITYYALSGVLMADGTSRAFYDFEDGETPGAHDSGNPLRVSEKFTGGTSNLSIVDCDADHISATGSTKCLKIDFSEREPNPNGDNYYDSQIDLFFNGTLTQGHTYYVHFWTKAETHVNDKQNTLVEFQQNGDSWDRSHINSDVDYDTSWHEYMYEVQPSRDNASMMCFDLGKVYNNVLYIDDIAVFDATSGTTPVSFSDLKSTAVISSSAFSDYAVGDYIQLNVTGSPSNIGYKSHASNDEYKVPYLAEYTDLEQTNGNWLIPVTSDIKSNGLSIKGYNMTLNSVDIYKKVAISEATNNTISSKEDHVVVELTRSFVANTWNTVCLPFTLTSDQATQLFGSGYQLAEYTSVSGTTMHFTTITINDFEAGKPYLVLPETGCATGTTVLSDVDITAKTPQTVTHGDYSFVGNFTQKTFTSADNTTSRFVATENELVTPNENSTLKSLRCYFTVPVAAARSLSFDVDEEGGTTSINTVQGSGVMVNGYYNLNGQRVAKPTKGLFIVNGKKVLVNDKR